MLCSVGFGGLVENRLNHLCFLIVPFSLGRTFRGLVGLFLRNTLALQCYWLTVIKGYDSAFEWLHMDKYTSVLQLFVCLSGPVFATSPKGKSFWSLDRLALVKAMTFTSNGWMS